MIIIRDDLEEIERLKTNLASEFEMMNLGYLKYFLGIEVKRSSQGIFINPKKYILDLLAETRLMDCKRADTPIAVNHGLQIIKGTSLADRGKYQCLVGKLIYLSYTRPDIAYAVSVVSQFMHHPQNDHVEAALRIVKYLKGTFDHGVMFKRNNHLEIHGYTDADWAGNPADRRSTVGYLTFIGGNLVSWKSKKQKVVALSSAEAEFKGIRSGLTERSTDRYFNQGCGHKEFPRSP
ncbi:secreted RxLR effector protein 161-like [Salvia splendens]|uniref:secreted RxLR effector protein 161-like n=1 Tax=Salvia splendens TaxID=180675 RepID=UPI001C2533C9|nr:secreted RxLR effector protein 161-like [Salvia splendens]